MKEELVAQKARASKYKEEKEYESSGKDWNADCGSHRC